MANNQTHHSPILCLPSSGPLMMTPRLLRSDNGTKNLRRNIFDQTKLFCHFLVTLLFDALLLPGVMNDQPTRLRRPADSFV